MYGSMAPAMNRFILRLLLMLGFVVYVPLSFGLPCFSYPSSRTGATNWKRSYKVTYNMQEEHNRGVNPGKRVLPLGTPD
jgi:hypothetical protein